MRIPNQNQMNNNDDTRRRNSGAMRIKGTVIMQYSNYKINTGLSDSLFEEKKK